MSHAHKAWRVVIAVAVAQLVSWGSIFYSFSLFVVPMENELGWSRVTLNGALSLGLLVSGLFAYPIGVWIDRGKGRMTMALGTLLASCLLVCWAYVESVYSFYAIWFGLGIVMATTLYDPIFAVMTYAHPNSYRHKITVITLIGGFASTIFIPLAGWLVHEFGWRHALLCLAFANVTIGFPIYLMGLRFKTSRMAMAEKESENRKSHDHAFRKALRHPAFWGLMICFPAYYATYTAIIFHLIPLLVEHGMAMATIISAIILIGPSQVSARIVLLALHNKISTAAIGQIVFLVFLISIPLLIFMGNSVTLLILFALLFGSANGMVTIIRGTVVPDLLWKEGYGSINGFLSLPSNIAKALGPIGAALIWEAGHNYNHVLWTLVCVAFVALLGFCFAVEKSKKLQKPQALNKPQNLSPQLSS